MHLKFDQLKDLLVETNSGIKLGHVSDIILETEGQLIIQYIVKSFLLSNKKYLINREQVINIINKKMIVDDNVSIVLKKQKELLKPKVDPNPIMMQKE